MYQANENVEVHSHCKYVDILLCCMTDAVIHLLCTDHGGDGKTETLNWISTIYVGSTHATAQNKAFIDNPGAWIYEEPEFVSWMSSQTSLILWLRGDSEYYVHFGRISSRLPLPFNWDWPYSLWRDRQDCLSPCD